MFVEVYEQIISAVFFFEVVMIALLAIKKSFAAILVRPFLQCSAMQFECEQRLSDRATDPSCSFLALLFGR